MSTTIDKQIKGYNLCNCDCIEKNETIHPETCVNQVLVGNGSIPTLDDWLRYKIVDDTLVDFGGFDDYNNFSAWLEDHMGDLQHASKSTFGFVKIGDNINVENGIISVDIPEPSPSPKQTPATYNTLGEIRLGNNEIKIPDVFINSNEQPYVDSGNIYHFPLLITSNDNHAGISIKKSLFPAANYGIYMTDNSETTFADLSLDILRFSGKTNSPSFTILSQLTRIETELQSLNPQHVYPLRIDQSTIPGQTSSVNAAYVYVPWENTTYPTLSSNNHDANTTYVIKGAGNDTGWENKLLTANGTWIDPFSNDYGIFNGSSKGLVPAPYSNTGQFLRGDGNWSDVCTVIEVPSSSVTLNTKNNILSWLENMLVDQIGNLPISKGYRKININFDGVLGSAADETNYIIEDILGLTSDTIHQILADHDFYTTLIVSFDFQLDINSSTIIEFPISWLSGTYYNKEIIGDATYLSGTEEIQISCQPSYKYTVTFEYSLSKASFNPNSTSVLNSTRISVDKKELIHSSVNYEP